MRDRLLPNIVAGRRIVPEFVPYAGGAEPIARAAIELLATPARLQAVAAEMAAVRATFGSRDPSRMAAEVVARSAAGERLSNDDLDELSRRPA
jgi:lipid A disaccharide synthetase